MVGVLEVEESGPVLLPHPLVLLPLQVPGSVRVGAAVRGEALLEPHLAEEHVQRDGAHQEPGGEAHPGAQGLHAGPAVSRINPRRRWRWGGGGGGGGSSAEASNFRLIQGVVVQVVVVVGGVT